MLLLVDYTLSVTYVVVHDFDDEVEDGLEMEYTFQRPPAAVADLDSELALSEIYMGVSDKEEWDKFKGFSICFLFYKILLVLSVLLIRYWLYFLLWLVATVTLG